ncbi:hypothetical protein HAX54_009639 [Datura stramonium]|uniref:Uncharacterized protein n=1 Tax=Datura stramonium TaxID=4076 RepID=A0ABS8TGZ1_DATST|nr:hypothetical protein [Datura stramonium]
MLITGDIVEELRIGNMILRSPFKNGKNGIQKIMHNSFKAKETSISVRVRRGSDDELFTELQACIVPNEFGGRKQYMLRAIDDPNYAVGFVDRTEMECLELQGNCILVTLTKIYPLNQICLLFLSKLMLVGCGPGGGS